MQNQAFKLSSAALLLVLAGCASVDVTPNYDGVQDQIAAATGADDLYVPGQEGAAHERVTELLEGGLTAQEAVQVCLLNNRELQVRLFEIGLSQADAVQAGMLSNPSLEALIRFPVNGGSTGTEFGLLQNLIELWRRPALKGLAEGEVDRVTLDVAFRAVELAAQAKSEFYTAQASEAALAVAEENLGTTQEFLQLTRERLEAGAATQVDLNAARSEYLEQQVFVRSTRFDALEAKRRLAGVLGVTTPARELRLVGPPLALPEWSVDLEQALEVAAEHRLDLRSAVKAVELAWDAIPLERRPLLRSLSGGLDVELEGGDLALGPAVELELPIFDQNQAQIAKAELRYARELRQLAGLEAQVAQQVRGAYEALAMAKETARLYRAELLPLRESGLELARESFAAGKTGFLSVLEAQEQLLEARSDYVDWLEFVAMSIPALEAACGRPILALQGPAETAGAHDD